MKVVNNFIHRKGLHCGSTALANLAGFHGHRLSEAMCFGLGEGPGFFYRKSNCQSPSRAFNGRNAALEPLFFHNLGIDFSWREGSHFPWDEMKEWIDRDIPVLILTDLYYLDYYHTGTHFSGHTVVLAGYDSGAEVALLADTEREELQSTSLESLALAMKSEAIPFTVNNSWREVSRFDLPDLSQAVSRALYKNALAMLQPPNDSLGLAAMDAFSRDLPSWAEAEDWSWCARYAYQVIERRGTGGSGFRLLYGDFLKEAEYCLPSLKKIQCGQKMSAIADQWSNLAQLLKEISENSPKLFPQAGEAAARLADMERSFFTDVLELF